MYEVQGGHIGMGTYGKVFRAIDKDRKAANFRRRACVCANTLETLIFSYCASWID